MAEILDNAAHLAQTIGPRPAGTEEERQAALYLSEALQRKAGLPTEVEDFTCSTDFELPRAIYCLVAVVLTALTFFIPVMVIVAFIVVLIMAALYAVETLVRPLLAPMMSHGASQNVVAKYEPAGRPAEGARGARQRKVVLLAHYDTGKVRAELKPALAPLLPILNWVELGGMVLLALLLLLRLVSTPTGGFAVVVTVLTVAACIAALLPVVTTIMHRSAPYTDGANCNAAGVAVMVEVATRLRKGRARADEVHAMEVRVHGEDAARAGGLVPEGASLTYEAEATESEPGSAEDRLMAAKAAVAMLTGKPVSATVNIDLDASDEQPVLVQNAAALVAEEEHLQTDAALVAEAAEAVAAAPQAEGAFDPRDNTVDEKPVTFTLGGPAPAPVPAEVSAAPTVTFEPPVPAAASESDVPDWFKAARAKARKSPGGQMPVTRSRYAEAEAVAQEAINARNAALEAQAAAAAEHQAMTETEQRLAQVRESIMEQHPVRPAPAAAAEGDAAMREEVSTVAFAPVEINGDELRREAQKQKAADQVEAKTAAPAAEAAAAAADATAEKADSAPEAAPAPKVAEAAAARIDNLRKSIPLVGDAPAVAAPAAEAAAEATPTAPAPKRREATSEEQKARQDALRQVLPSLSGSIKVSPDLFAKDAAPKADDLGSEKTDAFAPVQATKAFSPVTEASAELLTEEEIVEDADDSSYDGQLTETGAYTGSEYVEMPEGRASRFFGKFRRGKKDKKRGAIEPSAAEWLDVDEDYDARARGEELGEWSTRNRYVDEADDDSFDDFDDYDAFDEDDAFADSGFKPRGWNGGVFSRESLDKVRGMVKRGDQDAEPASAEADAQDTAPDGDQGQSGTRRRRRKAAGVDALFADTSAAAAALAPADEADDSALAPLPAPDDRSTAAMSALDDVQAVHDFRLPNIGIEVWFVALGADLAANSGMKDFLNVHRDELKGAIFIDLDAMGAGNLTCINNEGMYFPTKPSSRMARYARKAASALGIHLAEGSMLWRDSAAAVALRQGCQAMHFAGMDGELPAYAASKQDTMDNISEDTMLANADFVVEVLKNI